MTQVGAGGAFGDERREFADETPTPPMGMSWSGSLLTDGAGSSESERATQPVSLPGARSRSARDSGRGVPAEVPARAETDRSGAEGAPTAPGPMGLAELLAAEDVGRAGPAVLGADNPDAASGDAGDWPTLQRRERQEPQGSGGALGWIRRRREQ